MELKTELEALERQLHHPDTRNSREKLELLLHEDFLEFALGGRRYTKSEIIRHLLDDDDMTEVWSGGYQVQYNSPGAVLLNYRSAFIEVDGSFSTFALRSSLWVRNANIWQMLFHQGTATAPFEI